MTYIELKEMSKKKTFDELILLNSDFANTEGLPVPIEEIFPMFPYVKTFFL